MAILDLTIIRSYLDGDREGEREIIEIFLRKSNQDLEGLEQSMTGELFETWRQTNHSLKSSAALLGADTLRGLCLQGELMTSFDKQSILAHFENIKIAYDAVVEALNREKLV
jgi:HPt (histidine-containing phosphotransfer) domain-containing protein